MSEDPRQCGEIQHDEEGVTIIEDGDVDNVTELRPPAITIIKPGGPEGPGGPCSEESKSKAIQTWLQNVAVSL